MAKSPSPDNPYSAGSVAEAGWRLATFRDQRWSTTRDQEPPLCADIGFAAVGIPVAQIWVFGTRHGQTRRVLGAVGSSGQSLGRRAWFTSRATAQASATGPMCLSLSGLLTERIVWICPSSTSSAKM